MDDIRHDSTDSDLMRVWASQQPGRPWTDVARAYAEARVEREATKVADAVVATMRRHYEAKVDAAESALTALQADHARLREESEK